MERIVVYDQKIDDLYGLLVDLKRKEFAVRNVGSDMRGTYLYLEDYEEKDPFPIMEQWVGKVAPRADVSLYQSRKTDAVEVFGTIPPEDKTGFWKKLLRKFF